MLIGLSYDLKEDMRAINNLEDSLEEYDTPETVELIAGSLRASGHTVIMLGGGRGFLDNIRLHKVDLVFNIAEGHGNYHSREAQVPAILEMLDIPYTGSDPLCLATCLDKPLAKKLVALERIPTPEWFLIESKDELKDIYWQGYRFPLIIKPAHEGSSKGIRLGSVVENSKQAQAEVIRILDSYCQPVMVEEFIVGDEVTVGITGNSPAQILGLMHILPKNKNGHFVYSLEVKRDYKNRVRYECPAQLGPEVTEKISSLSLKVFKILGCRDFARIDFRISPDGRPYFIEINPLPGLGNHSDLVLMAFKLGWTHRKLVNTVLVSTLERYPQCVPV
jgi:D-alanine-D-alanine ligase